MKITDRQELEFRRVIRDAIAIDPLITTNRVVTIVEKKLGRKLEFYYINRLIKKVNREMVPNLDKEKIAYRIKDLRENYRITRERLLRIAFGDIIYNELGIPSLPTIGEQIRAWEAIGKLGKNLLEMEMDLGIFTRHIGEVDLNVRLKPIPEIDRQKVIAAFGAWGINPQEMRKVEFTEKPKDVEIEKEPVKSTQENVKSTQTTIIPEVADGGLVVSE